MPNVTPANGKLLEQAAQALSDSTVQLLKDGKWNSLDSDATAFRLAVRLNMDVITPTEESPNAICKTKDGLLVSSIKCDFTDPFKGVRRAITMTAAKITQEKIKTNGKYNQGSFIRDSIGTPEPKRYFN